jgi:hypothetical protein
MEGEISQLNNHEIEETIRELEHIYAEFLGGDADVHQLHHIRKRILELQNELNKRRSN